MRDEPAARRVASGSEPGAGDPRIGFVLRLGRALHTYGYPSHRLEDVVSEIGRAPG